MTRPVYDCKDPNCWTCQQAFRTREGLTAQVVEEARRVVEAEKDLNQVIGKVPTLDTGTDEGDDAISEAHDQNVTDAEMDMIAMVVRLSNAVGELDAFNSKQIS